MYIIPKKVAEEIKEKLGSIDMEIKDNNEEDYFDVIASNEETDRDGEIIKISGRKTENRMKNPVILANHNYTIENIVGKGLAFYEQNGVMRLKGAFATSTPMGQLAKALYNEGMLKAVSVGFIPLKRSDIDRKIIEEAELLEVSFVAVPANPGAIRDGKLYDEAVAKGLIKEVEEETSIEDEVKEIKESIKGIETMIKAMLDDKSKREKDFEQKEFLQDLNRSISDKLRDLKKA